MPYSKRLGLEFLEDRRLLAVTFSTGSGSAVSTVDRMATFDAAGGIDVSTYSEDMLFVTSPEGSIAAQPSTFDPFTAIAPGVSGFYGVANTAYVSIRPVDATDMAGIEFKLGDLFGAGPGQPPDPQSTYLVWETYRDDVLTNSDRILLPVGTIVGWSDPEGIDELRVGASGFPAFTEFGTDQGIALDDLRVQIDTSAEITFSTGLGSAVTDVDRMATFDAGDQIDVSGYVEDMLSVTSSEGSIAAQPGAFSPFTAEAPGVDGYFAVSNTTYVSIRPADSAVVTGVEFRLGDLFGVGPGQPPDARSTYLIWEAYRDGVLIGNDRVFLSVGTIAGWSAPSGINELRVGASGFPSFTEFGDGQAIALDDLRVEINTRGNVSFATGPAAAVTSADRIATFDPGASIGVADYTEDMLFITSAEGSIAAQPGAFNPFTGFAPGVAGFYGVSSTSFVSIRATDAARMAAVEFVLGDLFGAGPGQPPDPSSTYLVWETYRDGALTGTDRALLTKGTVVGWDDSSGIDELRVGASGFPAFAGFGLAQAIALDDLKVQLVDGGDVEFTTGAGSAVTAADRMATFDAGSGIDVADYVEDSLLVASAEGSIALQPGAFNPFTAVAPGISGYFAVANETYVSIRTADSVPMTGIEFMLGDLFGDGPGRPPEPFSTYLVWETYRGGVRTGTDRVFLGVGSVVGWSDPEGIDELRVGASGFPAFTGFGIAQGIALDDLAVQLEAEVETFAVTSFAPTETGFMAQFNEDIDASGLNVFDSQEAELGPADVILQGATSGIVEGSLVVDPLARAVTFIKSGDPLAPDRYTATLRSAADGFKDATGQLLDGDDNGTAGGDFIAQFDIVEQPAGAVSVGLADFVRGPGQDVNLPADTTTGIPLLISGGSVLRNAGIQIDYDPALLNITAAELGDDIPDGASLTLDTSTPGTAVLTFSSPADLPAEDTILAHLQASVPATDVEALLGRQHILDVQAVLLTDANAIQIPGTADDALHLVSYFGDVTGNRRINAGDPAQVARVAGLLDNGFAANPLTDPTIVGDISGNGRINASDASLVAQFAALLEVPQIPPIPAAVAAAGIAQVDFDGSPVVTERDTESTRRPAFEEGPAVSEFHQLNAIGPLQAIDRVMTELDSSGDREAEVAMEEVLGDLTKLCATGL